MTHHTHALALVRTRIAQHTADVVEAHRIIQELLGHEFHTQRVTRHDYSLGNLAIFGPDVGSWSVVHKRFLLLSIEFTLRR